MLTRVDPDRVSPGYHVLVVVSKVELPEGGKAGCPHPDLEVFVLREVWVGVLCRVAVREPVLPEWWGHGFSELVACRLVLARLSWPGDAAVCHVVRDVDARIRSCFLDERGHAKSVCDVTDTEGQR